ncbi:MAG: TonB-dependent receptor [bacterium]|nr:TonB-dependent receptor [bacterium]
MGTVVLTLAATVAAEASASEDDRSADLPERTEATFVADDAMDDIDLLELEVPIVVTASRRAQKITTVPYAMSVITAEDIRLSGARSVPDALRLAPGLSVAELAYGATGVSPRGFQGLVSRELLVLVDGRQLFDSFFGGTLWSSWPFQLEDVERIEVIRGPGGVAWGANAVNGVINIITKDPADQLGFTLVTGGGSRGTHLEHVGYAFREGNLRFRISGEYEASDGFREGGSILRSLDDDYKAGRATLYAIYEAGDRDTFTISAGNALLDGGYPPTPMAGVGLRRNSGSQASFILGKWERRITEDNTIELTGFVNAFHLSPGVPALDYRYQQMALQFSQTLKPAKAHTLTWGIDTRVDLLDTTNADPFMLTKDLVNTGVVGAYLQDRWQFLPRWTLDVGARIDYEFYGGFQPSARTALAYELSDDSMVYGAVSRAFQMHPAAMRFMDFPLMNGLARVGASRSIEAQSLIAYELGYRGRFLDRLNVNLALFWHEYGELTPLIPVLGPPGLLGLKLDEGDPATTYGVEVDAKYAVNRHLTLLGNYTFLETQLRSSIPFHLMDTITSPQHQFMVGARYDVTDDLHVSSHLYFVDAVSAPDPSNPFIPHHIDSYFRLDLRGEYEFLDDRASFAVGVRNLLDSGHYEGGSLFINDAEVPRMVFAEFRLHLE